MRDVGGRLEDDIFIDHPVPWQRCVLVAAAIPLMVLGGAFVFSGVWAVVSGELCWPCFAVGAPLLALAMTLGVAGLAPFGQKRDLGIDVAAAVFALSIVMAMIVPLSRLIF